MKKKCNNIKEKRGLGVGSLENASYLKTPGALGKVTLQAR